MPKYQRNKMPKDQRNEILAGIVALFIGAGAVLAAETEPFAYVILFVALAWLGGCWLYADTYD